MSTKRPKPVFFRRKEQTEYEMCRRKRRFKNREEAIKHNHRQRPYRCPHCEEWHLTSN